MASARLTTIGCRNAGAHVRHPRRLPRARRQIPCTANIPARRTPRSRRMICISGRHGLRQCLPLPSRSRCPRLLSLSLALLAFSQPLHVSNGPLDQFLNAFIAGRRCCRIPLEKEPPFLHHLDPCSRRFRQHLAFEKTEVRLRRGYRRRGFVCGSPPHLRLMSAGLGPATVQINWVIGHGSAPKAPQRPACGRKRCRIANPQVILRCLGARFRRAVRYRPSRPICVVRRRCAFPARLPGWLGAEPNRGHGARSRPPRLPA